jgi:hypothetical protein
MTRIESVTPDQREALKGEIKKEIRQESFRRNVIGCGGCALVIAVLLAIPTYFVAATLARTGFYEVPFLSQRLYKPSSPMRQVNALVGSNAKTALIAASAKSKFDPRTNLLTLALTETDLTTMAQETVRSAKPEDLPIPIRHLQVALDERTIEVFALSPQGSRDATVRVRFLPLVRSGGVSFEVQEVRIGDLELPKSVAQFFVGHVAKAVADAVLAESSEIGSLFSIELDKGAIRFLILPKKTL